MSRQPSCFSPRGIADLKQRAVKSKAVELGGLKEEQAVHGEQGQVESKHCPEINRGSYYRGHAASNSNQVNLKGPPSPRS